MYREYRGHVYRFLLRKTGNHHDAEDLTQRVFTDATAALRNAERAPRVALAWLYSVAERRLVDEIRRRVNARRALPLFTDDPAAPDSAYSREVATVLRASIGSLPADQRRVLVSKLLEGRSFAEIADRLGTSEAACKMRLSRAIAKIREDLSTRGLGPGA